MLGEAEDLFIKSKNMLMTQAGINKTMGFESIETHWRITHCRFSEIKREYRDQVIDAEMLCVNRKPLVKSSFCCQSEAVFRKSGPKRPGAPGNPPSGSFIFCRRRAVLSLPHGGAYVYGTATDRRTGSENEQCPPPLTSLTIPVWGVTVHKPVERSHGPAVWSWKHRRASRHSATWRQDFNGPRLWLDKQFPTWDIALFVYQPYNRGYLAECAIVDLPPVAVKVCHSFHGIFPSYDWKSGCDSTCRISLQHTTSRRHVSTEGIPTESRQQQTGSLFYFQSLF
ncbi:hypothetical protein J6590_007860 [Homalodisca vitripennis]|nr:hypothetical protein J6590_007860 [Homalodisca vitripennis]